MAWLARSAAGDELTRYHVEAGIAWEALSTATFADTDWGRIAELYDVLDRIAPSPVHALNRAVAEAHLARPAGRARPPGRLAPEDVPARSPAGTRSSANSTSASANTRPPSEPGRRHYG